MAKCKQFNEICRNLAELGFNELFKLERERIFSIIGDYCGKYEVNLGNL